MGVKDVVKIAYSNQKIDLKQGQILLDVFVKKNG